ncbi:MAG: amidase [Pseudomonadota bacterium]
MPHFTRRQSLKFGAAASAAALIPAGCDAKKQATTGGPPARITPIYEGPDYPDAVWLGRQIAKGTLTARDVVNSAIARAKEMNPAINAIVTPTFDAALEAAAAMKTEPASGADRPFAGVPTFIKDLMNVRGVETQFGSRAFKGHVPATQFPFIDDLEATGLISIGRSATPEFGLTATTEPLSSGPVRNPWNTDHSVGGSSGGAAALVAAGVVPMAHASDGGGSIRIPASCCGLVGLKPSRDRFAPVRDETRTPVRISVMGVVSRTVRDSAAFLHAMQLRGDQQILDPIPPLPDIGGEIRPARLKIGAFTNAPSGGAVHPDVVATIEETADRCASLGHDVAMIDCPLTNEIADDFLLYWAAFADKSIRDWETATGQQADDTVFEPLTLGLQAQFQREAENLPQAIINLIGFRAQYLKAFGDYDLLLSPVLNAPPPPIGYLGTTVDYDTAMARLVDYAGFTAPANIAGTPALSLPMGLSSQGLPIGAQFHGRPAREDQLLTLAAALENAFAWFDLKPPLYATKSPGFASQ